MTRGRSVADGASSRSVSATIDASGSLVLTGEAEGELVRQVTGGVGRRLRRRRASVNRVLALAIFTVLAAAALLAVWQDIRGPGELLRSDSGKIIRARLQPAPPVEEVLYDTRNLPIDPATAIEINAERPPDIRDVVAARPFAIGTEPANALARQTALECLAQAIYYEAAGEGEEGQRAVAQVILNRVRNPAFPNTICGVVYQGWTRVTGCQFSFTCDGSMARAPSPSGMARARRIAGEALGGVVMAGVGNATHYHADYVVPYWASSLDKARTVGRHIFYLIRGGLGRPAAFTARYLAALEQSPFGALEPGVLGLAAETLPGLEGAATPGSSQPANPLNADLALGELIAPGGTAIASSAGLGFPGATSGDMAAEPQLRADDVTGNPLMADERRGVLLRDRPRTAGQSSGN